MANHAIRTLAKHLETLSAAARVDNLPDRELVQRFASGRDEDAFAALVRRHGPMVLGICRRILRDEHDAEDVFQAVFLVFSRKAASLRHGEAVGCWLHRTAIRLALKARTQLARRRRHENRAAEPTAPADPLSEVSVREAQTILDEELARLPEKFRAPLLLCCLEGKSRDEAARQLDWSASLVKNRLQQGRQRLRDRLIRRGLTLSAALASVLVMEQSAPAAVPALLLRATVQAVQAGPAGGVSAQVAFLAESALHGTGMVKAKIAVGLLLLMGALAAGVGAFVPSRYREGAHTNPLADARGSDDRGSPKRDRFGDPLPEGAVARLGTVRWRHGFNVLSVAFAPDGKTLASGGQDNAVRLWDIASGKPLQHFTPQRPPGSENAWVRGLAFSPDGKRLAAGAIDVVIWDRKTGKELRRLRTTSGQVTAIAFAPPDGNVLAASFNDGSIHVWDVRTGAAVHMLQGHRGWIESVAFAPDGKTLASAGRDKTVRLWDTETGRELRQLKGHSDQVLAVVFSPDGKTLASASWDNTIRLWDAASGKESRLLKGHASPVDALAFFPDGKTLASGSWDRTVRIWEAATGKELRQMQGHQGPVPAVAVSPDGKTLASGSWDRTVRLWDAATGKEVRPTQGNQGGLWSVAVSPDGRRVATGGEEGVVRLWDASSGKEMLHLIEPNTIAPVGGGTLRMIIGDHLRFSDEGKSVSVSSGWTFGRWETETGKQIQRRRYAAQGMFAVPGGKHLIGRDGQANFCLVDAATGKTIRRFKTSQNGFISALSPDGHYLALNSTSEDGTVVIWELATGKERCRCKAAPSLAYALTFSPDGKYLAGSTTNLRVFVPDNPIYLWDAVTGREIRRFRASGHQVASLSYSSDGRMLASGGGDKTVRLWETATGKERLRFGGHQGAVRAVAFSSDGTRLVSASDDTTALVWDTTGSAVPSKLTDQELQAAWNDLAGDDAAKAYRAIWLLAHNPVRSMPLLREHLPIARAPNAKIRQRIEQWLKELDSDEAAVRQRASAALKERILVAEPMLRQALSGRPSLEQRKRIERLLEALRREQVILDRALEALEHTSAAEARQLLGALAEGESGAWITQQAKAALQRRKTTP